MNGKELRRLVEKHERKGAFDAYQAAYELVWEDGFTGNILRSLGILADAVRKLDIWDLVDGQYKSAATWIYKYEPQKSACEDVEELLFLRPEHVLQLVKRIYTDWSKGIEHDLTR